MNVPPGGRSTTNPIRSRALPSKLVVKSVVITCPTTATADPARLLCRRTPRWQVVQRVTRRRSANTQLGQRIQDHICRKDVIEGVLVLELCVRVVDRMRLGRPGGLASQTSSFPHELLRPFWTSNDPSLKSVVVDYD